LGHRANSGDGGISTKDDKIMKKIIDIACWIVAVFGLLALLVFVLWEMSVERVIENGKCEN